MDKISKEQKLHIREEVKWGGERWSGGIRGWSKTRKETMMTHFLQTSSWLIIKWITSRSLQREWLGMLLWLGQELPIDWRRVTIRWTQALRKTRHHSRWATSIWAISLNFWKNWTTQLSRHTSFVRLWRNTRCPLPNSVNLQSKIHYNNLSGTNSWPIWFQKKRTRFFAMFLFYSNNPLDFQNFWPTRWSTGASG
jgi:hypothetical protein